MAATEPAPSRPGKRATTKPAWMKDSVDPSQLIGEAKAPRQSTKRSSHDRAASAQQEQRWPGRGELPRRMCLNPGCKSPFESPQWRRGPLGPGTLCNACGTRYARIDAKRRGERKGGAKLRPQDLADWLAFEQQLANPISPADAWQAYAEHHRARGAAAAAAAAASAAAAGASAAAASASAAAAGTEARLGQQQLQELLAQAAAVEQQGEGEGQQHGEEDDCEDAFEDDGTEGDWQQHSEHEQPRHQQPRHHQQQQDEQHDDELLCCEEGVPDSDSPGDKSHAASDGCQAAAAVRRAAPLAGAGSALSWSGLPLPRSAPLSQPQQLQQQEAAAELASGSPEERSSPLLGFGPAARPSRRRPRRHDDEAAGSDSQEAAACSWQEPAGACASSNATASAGRGGWGLGGGGGGGGEQFLHLLAVGEAMMRLHYVEEQPPCEQRREAETTGLKRSRFGQQAGEAGMAGQGECAPPAAPAAAAADQRYERLLAEAEQCIRARSASPCMRGVAGAAAAASPLRRPLTAAGLAGGSVRLGLQPAGANSGSLAGPQAAPAAATAAPAASSSAAAGGGESRYPEPSSSHHASRPGVAGAAPAVSPLAQQLPVQAGACPSPLTLPAAALSGIAADAAGSTPAPPPAGAQ